MLDGGVYCKSQRYLRRKRRAISVIKHARCRSHSFSLHVLVVILARLANAPRIFCVFFFFSVLPEFAIWCCASFPLAGVQATPGKQSSLVLARGLLRPRAAIRDTRKSIYGVPSFEAIKWRTTYLKQLGIIRGACDEFQMQS